MGGPRDYHIKWNKSDQERQIWYDIAYMDNKKKLTQMSLFTKQKQTHRLREWNYGYQGEEWGWGIDWEFGFGIDMCILLYLK